MKIYDENGNEIILDIRGQIVYCRYCGTPLVKYDKNKASCRCKFLHIYSIENKMR